MKELLDLAGNTTKEKVIRILSNNWPLTAKKIHNSLKKDHGASLTYQATYKAINELLKEKVLERGEEGYKIDLGWIKKIESLAEKMKNELTQEKFKKEIKFSSKITFKNYGEFLKFFIDFIEEIQNKEKNLNITFHYRHVPNPNVLSEEDIRKIRKILSRGKWTIISKKDSPVGRWNAKQWETLGVNTKIAANIFADSMIIVNDYLINLHTRKESINNWDERVNNLENYVVRPTNEDNIRSNTIITILKDKELAKITNDFAIL